MGSFEEERSELFLELTRKCGEFTPCSSLFGLRKNCNSTGATPSTVFHVSVQGVS